MTLTVPTTIAGGGDVLERDVKLNPGQVVIAQDATAIFPAVIVSAVTGRGAVSAVGMDVTGATASMGKLFPTVPAEIWIAGAVTVSAVTAVGATVGVWIVMGAAARPWNAATRIAVSRSSAASVLIAVRALNAVIVSIAVRGLNAVIVSIAAISEVIVI